MASPTGLFPPPPSSQLSRCLSNLGLGPSRASAVASSPAPALTYVARAWDAKPPPLVVFMRTSSAALCMLLYEAILMTPFTSDSKRRHRSLPMLGRELSDAVRWAHPLAAEAAPSFPFRSRSVTAPSLFSSPLDRSLLFVAGRCFLRHRTPPRAGERCALDRGYRAATRSDSLLCQVRTRGKRAAYQPR